MKKSIFAVFLLFSLLLVNANMGCATKDLGGYWKNMMKGQPMPEAIKALIDQDPLPRASDAGNKDRFIRDFDVKPNFILYHTHVVPMKQNSYNNPRDDAMAAEQTIKKG